MYNVFQVSMFSKYKYDDAIIQIKESNSKEDLIFKLYPIEIFDYHVLS